MIRPETIAFLERRIDGRIDCCLVLGSGLGTFISHLENALEIDTRDVPFYPHSTVMGHAGKIFLGTLERRRILVFQGRIHRYEGYSFDEVVLPIDLAHLLGARVSILTNASGGLNPRFCPGEFMHIVDHFTLPLMRIDAHHGVNTRSLRKVLLKGETMQSIVRDAAQECSLRVHEGTYCYLQGPTYETRAEIRMLRKLGADVVGMSTVPEIIRAEQLEHDVVAISLITNSSSEVAKSVTHDEVTTAAESSGDSFARLLRSIIRRATVRAG